MENYNNEFILSAFVKKTYKILFNFVVAENKFASNNLI